MFFLTHNHQQVIDDHPEATALAIAPFSIEHSLALLWMCASGQVADELNRALCFSGTKLTRENAAKCFASFHEEFADCDTLKLIHKLFTAAPVKATFAAGPAKQFTTDVAQVSSASSVSELREAVNKWAETETRGKCPELMNNSRIDWDKTETIDWLLCDVFQFHSPWAIAFESCTQRHPFWVTATESVDVEMMHLRDSCRYGFVRDLDAAILELNFDDEDMSMIFIVPEEKAGLAALEAKLQSINVMYLAVQLRRQDTLVFVPKFTVDTTFALEATLAKLGITSLFSGTADLDEVFELSASSAEKSRRAFVHRTAVVIDESGSESDKQKIGEHAKAFYWL